MAETTTHEKMMPAQVIREPLSDVNATALMVIILSGALCVADIVIFVVAFHLNSARAEFERQVVQVPYRELQEYREQQTVKLHTYGPSPNRPGAFTIPIDRAIELYAAEQGAGQGTGPGGTAPTLEKEHP
jgi:hypothetical protein